MGWCFLLGAVDKLLSWHSPRSCFQSTLPRRERRIPHILHQQGAGFQSTLPRRERPHILADRSALCRFQSTLPRRERLDDINCTGGLIDFNPRSRVGRDRHTTVPCGRQGRFQSTLPRRERHTRTWRQGRILAFQSTLPRRERPQACQSHAEAAEFQSTLPRRERQTNGPPRSPTRHFNPRSRVGSDEQPRAKMPI